MPYTYPYPRPALTADAVLFTVLDKRLQILLIQRASEPFAGLWALPGGFVEEGEDAAAAVCRELEEEAGVRGVSFDQLRTFDTPGRDPRGWVVAVAHLALIDAASVQPAAADDAAGVRWWPVANLPSPAFDHGAIVSSGLARLSELQRYSVIGSQLLPSHFTLEALRHLYEAVQDKTLDQAVFERNILDSGALRESEAESAGEQGQSRPTLYEFVRRAAI